MNVLIVTAHPEPKSFNQALTNLAIEKLSQQGHQVQISNLYQMKFNPVSDRQNFLEMLNPDFLKLQTEELHASIHDGFSVDLNQEWEKLSNCDLLIMQFPLWWFGMPAIMKGWVDRVFASGRAYSKGKYYELGHFKDKKAMLSVTTGGKEETFQTNGFHGDISGILRPIHRGIFEFTGFSVLEPAIYYAVAHVDETIRKVYLDNWAKRLSNIENETPISVGSY